MTMRLGSESEHELQSSELNEILLVELVWDLRKDLWDSGPLAPVQQKGWTESQANAEWV